MMYTTVGLSTYQATAQTGKSATDLVELYTEASIPCYKTEFKKNSRLILQCGWSVLDAVTLREMAAQV